MNALARLLAERIARDGPLTFREFMAQALYHPQHGYYASGRAWDGEGDFATAPQYSPLFAGALAAFALGCKAALGPGPFEVVEVGGGRGDLAAQLHQRLAPEGVRVRSVEVRRPPKLPPQVPWTANVDGLDLRGVVLSNELFDALPVHLVRRLEGRLEEAFVVVDGGSLALAWRDPSRADVPAYLDRFGMDLPEGHVAEVGLDALVLLRRIAGAMREGVVLTIDYGHDAPTLAERPQGTLTALRAHRLSLDPLADPGEQDLTAHVNLTALRAEGEALHLEPVAELPQWRFLAALGALDGVAARLQQGQVEEALAAKMLLAPGRLGDFRVLVQAKGVAPAARERLARWLLRETL